MQMVCALGHDLSFWACGLTAKNLRCPTFLNFNIQIQVMHNFRLCLAHAQQVGPMTFKPGSESDFLLLFQMYLGVGLGLGFKGVKNMPNSFQYACPPPGFLSICCCFLYACLFNWYIPLHKNFGMAFTAHHTSQFFGFQACLICTCMLSCLPFHQFHYTLKLWNGLC